MFCLFFSKHVRLDLENWSKKMADFSTSDPPTTKSSYAESLLHSPRGKKQGLTLFYIRCPYICGYLVCQPQAQPCSAFLLHPEWNMYKHKRHSASHKRVLFICSLLYGVESKEKQATENRRKLTCRTLHARDKTPLRARELSSYWSYIRL